MPTKHLQVYYNNLNESSKYKLRKSYSEQFEFSRDTFYKKLNGVAPLKKLARKFFCEWFNVNEDILFPLYESVK